MEAERAISGLPLTEENHRKATELLKELFRKTQNLTNAYMESLSKIQTPSSDTKNLREFHDICEANMCGLETLWSNDRIIWKFANSHTPKENTRGHTPLNIQSGSFSR